REKLLHDAAHLDLLRDQVESLATELDSSKTGLLDDYPGECYPGDVMASLMCIKRADAVLGTDHSKFLNRAFARLREPRQPGITCHPTPQVLPRDVPYRKPVAAPTPTCALRRRNCGPP